MIRKALVERVVARWRDWRSRNGGSPEEYLAELARTDPLAFRDAVWFVGLAVALSMGQLQFVGENLTIIKHNFGSNQHPRAGDVLEHPLRCTNGCLDGHDEFRHLGGTRIAPRPSSKSQATGFPLWVRTRETRRRGLSLLLTHSEGQGRWQCAALQAPWIRFVVCTRRQTREVSRLPASDSRRRSRCRADRREDRPRVSSSDLDRCGRISRQSEIVDRGRIQPPSLRRSSPFPPPRGGRTGYDHPRVRPRTPMSLPDSAIWHAMFVRIPVFPLDSTNCTAS